MPVLELAVSKRWCLKNSGKRFPEMMGMSCLKYAITPLMGKHEHWKESVKLEESLDGAEERKIYETYKKRKHGLSQEIGQVQGNSQTQVHCQKRTECWLWKPLFRQQGSQVYVQENEEVG